VFFFLFIPKISQLKADREYETCSALPLISFNPDEADIGNGDDIVAYKTGEINKQIELLARTAVSILFHH
jgi:hypothetical protein